jgi:hypothetical protein
VATTIPLLVPPFEWLCSPDRARRDAVSLGLAVMLRSRNPAEVTAVVEGLVEHVFPVAIAALSRSRGPGGHMPSSDVIVRTTVELILRRRMEY